MDYKQWKLVFEDHFDKQEIDREVWKFEKGFIRNNEPQYYTDRPENAYTENSDLVIVTRREEYRGASYTSASLNTQGTKAYQYGLFEMRAKLPRGKGIWPAFWTLGESFDGTPWPLCGEIDIMETIGNCKGSTDASMMATVHWKSAKTGMHAQESKTYFLKEGVFAEDYHTFAIDWSADRIIWLLDGEEIFRVKITDDMQGAFHQPHFILVNTALSNFNDDERPDETTPLPQEYRVDYVRIYQLKK